MKLTPRKKAITIAKIADSKKGEDIKVLNLKKISTLCDYFVIISGNSEPHIETIFEEIKRQLKKFGIYPYHYEGIEYKRWIILDYGDVMVHIMNKELRDYYALERIWAEAKNVNWYEKGTKKDNK